MAAQRDAVAWLAARHLAEGKGPWSEGKGRWMDAQFQEILRRPELQMAADLWSVRPDELAVKVLKAVGFKVPGDWLSPDKPTGRFASRKDLLETVWIMASNKRLTSEIAANVELPVAAIKLILSTGEGRPAGLELPAFSRSKVRRGLVG